MLLFSPGIETVGFISLILIWSLLEALNFGVIPWLRGKGGMPEGKNHNRGSNLLLRVVLYISIIGAMLLAVNNIAMLPAWFFYPGAMLMAGGILLRQWAISTLGRFFTINLKVQESQKVVDNGPYRFIRHPSYLGMAMIVLGIGVALQSLAGILVIVVLYGLAIGYRIHVEEKFLVSELGDEYSQYMKRTKRLIPFLF